MTNNIINTINSESEKVKFSELYGNDIVFTILALIITFFITLYFIILINFKKYHKAWKENENNIRCQPIFMPFSKYISEGPLFNKPISGSENFKYCVDKMSGNISQDYSNDFTGIRKYIDNFYRLIVDSIISVKLLLNIVLQFFYELIKNILSRFVFLTKIIKNIITRALNSLNIISMLFKVFWTLVIHLITLIKYILIYLINLLYLCILGPVGRLIMLITTWVVIVAVVYIIMFFFFLINIPLGGWPFFLGATLLMASLLVIIAPVTVFINLLFLALVNVITRLNSAVMNLIDMLDIGITPDYDRYEEQQRTYLINQRLEAIKNPFEAPSFDRCLDKFKNN